MDTGANGTPIYGFLITDWVTVGAEDLGG